jgi:hypothetical protein
LIEGWSPMPDIPISGGITGGRIFAAFIGKKFVEGFPV